MVNGCLLENVGLDHEPSESVWNSDRPRPGGNAGLPKIGNRGDSLVESKAEKTALDPRRIVEAIRG